MNCTFVTKILAIIIQTFSLDEVLVSYLNLITLDMKIEGELKSVYGVGNVCALERSKGWGKEIICRTNKFIIKSKKPGILFCKKSLVNFYSTNHWTLIEKDKVFLSINNDSIDTMLFNCNIIPHKVEYMGKLF